MEKKILIPLLILAIGAIAGGSLWFKNQGASNELDYAKTKNLQYSPVIKPSDFVGKVDNKYFALLPGSAFTYENKTGDGLERIIVEVSDETKTVMGVNTVVVRDRVWRNDQLVEDTRDWYAQDNKGNVWYFGEEVDNYSAGKLVNHSGAWEAGLNGGLPGIIMPADPKVGFSYRQEYLKGEAEDMGEIVGLKEKVNLAYGSFEDCLKIRDWSLIEKTANEYKYYCPEIGFVVLEESASERVELVAVVKN